MNIGPIKRILEVEPEPFEFGHIENAPEEPAPAKEPVYVPAR